jgi:hypothetical protein
MKKPFQSITVVLRINEMMKKTKKTTLEDIKSGFSLFPSPLRVSGKVLHVYLIWIKSVFYRPLSRKICTPITPKKNKQAYNA